MWIEEVKKDNTVIAYKFIERYENPYTKKMTRVSIRSAKNTAAIRKEMPEKLRQKFEETVQPLPEADTLTFRELTEKWLQFVKRTQKKSTYRTSVTRVKDLNKYIGDYNLKSLNPIILNELMLQLLSVNKYSTVSLKRKTLKQILTFAHDYGYMTDGMLVNKIKLEKTSAALQDNQWKYLEKNEIHELLARTKNEEYRRLFELMILNGWRVGEALSLDYTTDINFDECYVEISKTYNYVTKEFELPKSNKKRRNYVNERSMQLIKEQIEHDCWKKHRYQLPEDNNLLFKTVYGNPLSLSGINKYLKKINPTNKTLSTHIFRHTFITMMVERGVSQNLIAQHVGHTDTQMIERVYKHFSKSMEEQLKMHLSSITLD